MNAVSCGKNKSQVECAMVFSQISTSKTVTGSIPGKSLLLAVNVPRQSMLVHFNSELEEIVQTLALRLGLGRSVAPDIANEY